MNVVLVHGGWQGGWVWEQVAERLTASGHRVLHPTLRGLEEGDAERRGIGLGDLIDDLIGQIDAAAVTSAVLVGHSGGGPVVQGIADRWAGTVERVVFMDAWVLHDGESINDVLPRELTDGTMALAAQSDDDTVTLPAERFFGAFAQDIPEAERAGIARRLVPTPVGWLAEPLRIDFEAFSAIPSSYVFFDDDLAVPQEIYRAASARLAKPRIVTCTGSHQVMLADPDSVAGAIGRAIA